MNRSVLLIWLTLGVSIKSIRDSTSAVIRIVLLPKFIALNYYTAKLSPNPMSLLLSSCHFHHLPTQQRKSHTLDDNQSITPVHHRVQFRQSSANYFPVMIFIHMSVYSFIAIRPPLIHSDASTSLLSAVQHFLPLETCVRILLARSFEN